MKNLHTFEDFLNESKQILVSAIDKVKSLPKGKLFDDAKNIEKIFKISKHSWNEVVVAYEKHEDEHHIVTIDLSDIHITQPNVQSGKVMKMIDDIKRHFNGEVESWVQYTEDGRPEYCWKRKEEKEK